MNEDQQSTTTTVIMSGNDGERRGRVEVLNVRDSQQHKGDSRRGGSRQKGDRNKLLRRSSA